MSEGGATRPVEEHVRGGPKDWVGLTWSRGGEENEREERGGDCAALLDSWAVLLDTCTGTVGGCRLQGTQSWSRGGPGRGQDEVVGGEGEAVSIENIYRCGCATGPTRVLSSRRGGRDS